MTTQTRFMPVTFTLGRSDWHAMNDEWRNTAYRTLIPADGACYGEVVVIVAEAYNHNIESTPVADYADKIVAAIIASPRLYAALESVVEFWDSLTAEDALNDLHAEARAALAKARGEV